jgi:large subunit ribosomal protein L5
MQVPRVTKITLNMGVGDAKTEAKALDAAMDELSTDRRPAAQMRRARKSIAAFKLREGMPIGARSRCAAHGCTSSSTASSRSRCRGSATSAASIPARSTDAATTRSASRADHLPRDQLRRRRRRARSWTSQSRRRRQDDEGARALLRGLGLPFADDRREQE